MNLKKNSKNLKKLEMIKDMERKIEEALDLTPDEITRLNHLIDFIRSTLEPDNKYGPH